MLTNPFFCGRWIMLTLAVLNFHLPLSNGSKSCSIDVIGTRVVPQPSPVTFGKQKVHHQSFS